MKIVLPRLINSLSARNNTTTHLLQESHEIIFDSQNIVVHRGYTIIKLNGIEFCFIRNKNFVLSSEYEHVLHIDRQLTENSIDEVKIKSWLKHPKQLQYSTSQICDSWQNNFKIIEEDHDNGIVGLRTPQVSALYAILSHFRVSNEIATVVMPTGTGKTETMLSLLAYERCNRLLITVPSDALRNQISEKFITFGLLKKLNILNAEAINPKVAVLKQGINDLQSFNQFIEDTNVVVTTVNILSRFSENQLNQISEKFSHCFIDEAHHAKANSWEKITSNLNKTRIVQFTATPFREDGKTLNGKIIFNFSLKMAQEQGYFKPIDFIPIREYDLEKGDILIAEKAVQRLQEDLENGFNHILMARCETKTKAERIYDIYARYNELNPILVHSSIANKNEILQAIINLEHKIIVAVNMLGEGFDLPQLKISAFHDIRKSLPITLQFAGRFTRTSLDNSLGTASFIANLADPAVEGALSELYARDSNWNTLLAKFSSDAVNEQMDFYNFISEFQNLNKSQIPFQNIRFPMSAMVYKNEDKLNRIFLNRYEQGVERFQDCEYSFSDYSNESNTLIIITADKHNIDWVNYKDVYGLHWRLIVVHYDYEKQLLFIHDSDKAENFDKLANALITEPKQIKDLSVFRVLHGIQRLKLQNVGLKEFFSKDIRFTMRSGSDIGDALSDSVLQKTQKSFVSGAGYFNGNKVTIGCSYKGRVWSKLRGNLKEYINWCQNIGNTLNDTSIDPNQVLKATLIPKPISEITDDLHVIDIDWDENIYNKSESQVYIEIGKKQFYFSDCSIKIFECNQNVIKFKVESFEKSVCFEKKLISKVVSDEIEFDFEIRKLDSIDSNIIIGRQRFTLADYFQKNPPTIWFADGSSLTGNNLIEISTIMAPYSVDKLISWNWNGIDISKEAQGVNPIIEESVQFKVIDILKNKDFDIIYDDDGSGEIADVITIKDNNSQIDIQLYHLKYAKKGKVSSRVDNFYEVCGQAQKSIVWKHKKGSDFFEHLIRRKDKKKNDFVKSRIEKGSIEKIEELLKIANRKPIKFEVFIIQPSLSKVNPSESILRLLAVTETYLKDTANIELKVIANE